MAWTVSRRCFRQITQHIIYYHADGPATRKKPGVIRSVQSFETFNFLLVKEMNFTLDGLV